MQIKRLLQMLSPIAHGDLKQNPDASLLRRRSLPLLTTLALASVLAMGCAQSKFSAVSADANNTPLSDPATPTDPIVTPDPSPTPDATPDPTASPTPGSSPTPTPTPGSSPTPTPSPTPTQTSIPDPGRGPNIKWGCSMKATAGMSTFDKIKDKTVTMRLIPSNSVQMECVKTAGVYQSMDQFNDRSYAELPLSYCGSMVDGDYILTLTDSAGNNLTLTDPLETIHYVNGSYVISNSNAYESEWYPYVYYGVTSNSVGVNFSESGFADGCDSP